MPQQTSGPVDTAPEQAIRTKALSLGFDSAGITGAAIDKAQSEALRRFLKLGRHGDMDWMARKLERRASPTVLWPEARSVVVLGMNYGPAQDPSVFRNNPGRGAISIYAQGKDYHDVVKKRLKELARWMVGTLGGDVKVFTDTAPVMEKPLAARAGVGWQGKHTNLVSRTFGSWLFLGEVFTTLDLRPDAPEMDHCGSCDLCQRACPTGALDEAYRIDATRCISYLTIERKSAITPELMERMGNHLYGCDDCLAACPWNKFESVAGEPALRPRAELKAPMLGDLLDLNDASFRQIFAGSAIKRSGRDRIVRNALIAAGNSGQASLIPFVEKLMHDASEMVSHTAHWASQRLKAMDNPDE